MLFSLTNLKRRGVRDPDGEMAVVPKLLHGRTALKLVAQAIDVFEAYVGRTRAEYDPRGLEAVLGDYRLARCIEACLFTYYSFNQPQFSDLLTEKQIAGLAALDLNNSSDLRLAVWDAANARHGGFVLPTDRASFLAGLASDWGLDADEAMIDRLLALDLDASGVLAPKRDRPTAKEIVLQYNRGAVQTLLAHSTRVELLVSNLPGAALKRLYFIAKRRGVLVEIDLAPLGGYRLTLFGPEQAFGTAEKYGLQLADVTLSLVRHLLQLESSVQVTAELVLHDRPYRFHVTEEIMLRLDYMPERQASAAGVAETRATYSVGAAVDGGVTDTGSAPEFDSLIEAALYKEHKALERGGYTHGWLIEREPDPLLAPGIVLIPDFAFSRGSTRVFMEIAGFWSPSYRERKLSKLRSLADQTGGDTALLLAAPLDAVALFSSLPYPVVPYKTKVKATDIITAMDEHFGARAERQEAATTQISALQERAQAAGFVGETEVAQALEAYTRTELLASAAGLESETLKYVPGVGLLGLPLIEKLQGALQAALTEAGNKLPLYSAQSAAQEVLGTSVDVESLLQLWPQWRIDRPSLFDAYLIGDD